MFIKKPILQLIGWHFFVTNHFGKILEEVPSCFRNILLADTLHCIYSKTVISMLRSIKKKIKIKNIIQIQEPNCKNRETFQQHKYFTSESSKPLDDLRESNSNDTILMVHPVSEREAIDKRNRGQQLTTWRSPLRKRLKLVPYLHLVFGFFVLRQKKPNISSVRSTNTKRNFCFKALIISLKVNMMTSNHR